MVTAEKLIKESTGRLQQDGQDTLYKTAVSLGFGVLGFCANFYPLDVLIPPHKASFVWGLVFPMIISLTWGWRYGLLSSTLGLGAQTMWLLWLPNNGWAPFVAIPFYTLWIVWHGWCANNKDKCFSSFYLAEIPFRIGYAVVLVTLFSWSFRFNPSPWAPQMTLTAPPAAFINFLQFKCVAEGLMVLLLADVLINFNVIRKILLIPTQHRTKSGYIISGFLLLGIIFWILSGIIDYYFNNTAPLFPPHRNGKQTLAETLILDIEPQILLERLLFILICLGAGLIVAKAVARYKQSEEQYRELVEGTSDLIAQVDRHGRYKYVNHMSEPIFGIKPDAIIGQSAFAHLHADDQTGTTAWFNKCVENKVIFAAYENRVVNQQTGQLFHMLWNSNFHYDDEGNLFSVSGIAHNISERIKYENSLKRLELAVNQAQESILITDAAGLIQYANPAVSRISGYSSEELLGNNPRIFKSDKHDNAFYTHLWSTISAGKVWQGNFINRNKDGILFEESATISPVHDNTGHILNYVAVKRDVTEENRTKKMLQQSQKMEAVGTMPGGIAHDFNNILGIIIGYAGIAREDAPPGSKIVDALEKILVAGNRAKDLVNQILVFSRQTQVERIPLKPQPMIKEALKMLRASLPSTIEIRENISTEDLTMDADPTQLQQIVMNLCTNAFHAMEENGGVLTVVLEAAESISPDPAKPDSEKKNNSIRLSVTDTGKGIAPDIMDKIFVPFFTTKEQGKGTGMGLAIVYGIVQDYQGTIAVESQPGKGTTFHVYFPRAGGNAAANQVSTGVVPLGRERILFVDDEEFIVETGKQMLERLGYTVTTRQNSIEALKLFRKQPEAFDVVITDQTMPFMTGLELAQQMLRLRPDFPIILCTGYSNLVNEESAKKQGIKAFAYKPLTKYDFAVLVRQVLHE